MKRLLLVLFVCIIGAIPIAAETFNISVTMTVGKTLKLDPRADLAKMGKGHFYANSVYGVSNSAGLSVTSSYYNYTHLDKLSSCWTFSVTALRTGNYTLTNNDGALKTGTDAWNAKYSTATVIYNITVVDVTSITIPSKLTLQKGESYTFTPAISHPSAETTLSWSSSNSSVASVSNTGVVKTGQEGSAIITCTASNGISASCTVTVTPVKVTDVNLNFTEAELELGTKLQLEASVLPDNADNKSVTWTSSNESVAVVSSMGSVTAVGAGYANIVATTKDGSNINSSCLIHVVEPLVLAKSISLDRSTAELKVSQTAQLAATIAPANVSSTDISWSSSDAACVSVNSEGVINGLRPGTATITATTTDGTLLSASCVVTVKDMGLDDIANTIYFDNCEAFCGKTIDLSVKMKNTIEATGFQFDISLPKGVTVVQDEDGFYDITLSTERTTAAKTNTFDSSCMSDGSIRVLAASTRNYAFSGNDGEVCIIKLQIAEDLPAGDYPIILKNVELTNAIGQTWNVARLQRTITVKDYQLGDANGDGRVSVGDFSAIASHILGSTPDGFNLGAADVNQDNNISVGDLSAVATMILTEEAGSGASKVKAKAPEAVSDPNNFIYAAPVTISADGDATIVFNMKNAIAATGFQFNFKLPEGFYVTEDEDGFLDVFLSQTRTTSRRTNTFDCVKWSDGSYRVLAASTKNYEFSGNDGEVVTVHIEKSDEVESGDYELVLTEIELTDAQGGTFRTSKSTYNIVVPSNSNEYALVDGENYSNATTTTYDALTFTKTFSASAVGNWNAFYVPMSIDVEEYTGVLDFAEIYAFCATVDTNGDGTVNADDENFLFVRPVKTGCIEANVPYLVRPHEAKTYTINSADNILHKAANGYVEFSTTLDKFTVTGLNEAYTVVAGDNNYYVSASGKLNYRTTGSTSVKANRWIMHRESKKYGSNSSAASETKEYRIVALGEDMDEADAIRMISMSGMDVHANGNIYTIDGKKVNGKGGLQKGIYIKSGKKYIVK